MVNTLTDEVRILRISPDFATDHTLFALAGAGMELLRSTDGGENWSAFPFLADDILNATDLAVSPNFAVDRTLFVTGLGEASRSTDGGETWIPQSRMGPNYAVAISPNFGEDGTVWESYRLMEGIGDGTPESGIIRTVDRGASWALTSAGLPDSYEPFPRSLAVSPNYAADQTLFAGYGGQIVSTPERGLFRSGDGGDSWTDLGPAPGNPEINRVVVTHSARTGLTAHVATAHGVWHYGDPDGSAVVAEFPAPTSAPVAHTRPDAHHATATSTETPTPTPHPDNAHGHRPTSTVDADPHPDLCGQRHPQRRRHRRRHRPPRRTHGHRPRPRRPRLRGRRPPR